MSTLLVINILIVTLLSVIILSFAVYKYIKTNKRSKLSDYKIAEVLVPFIRDEIDHIIVPDGVGGLVEIERLILLQQGLLIVEFCPVSGHIFGTDTLDEWTQLIKGKRFRFTSPLQHMLASKQAVSALAPGIPVFCRVIFTEDAIFPKGRPSDVSVPNSLIADLALIKTASIITEKAQRSWDTIMKIARKNGQAVKA